MIQPARHAGICRTCGESITAGEPWFADGGDAHHLPCALQALPLQLAGALPAFTGDVPDRAAIEKISRLWYDVVEEPDDDGSRLVLADLLQTRGDPRGELIALQLANLQPERCDALIAEHGGTWLWRQRKIALAAQFIRGFVTRLQLSRDGDGADPEDPGLGTVEDLAFAAIGSGPANGDVYARYVESQAMHALRRIEVWDGPSLTAFKRTPARIVHVGCALWRRGLEDEGARFLSACARQPALSSLAVHIEGFETIAGSRVFDRLTEIAVVGRLGEVLPLWRRIPASMTLTATLSAKLAPCYGGPRGGLQLRRIDGDVVARASGDWARPGLLKRLPPIEKLVVEGADPDDMLAIRAEARGRVELEIEPAPIPIGCWLRGSA